ncbi:2,4-dienoyl-CoA reductase-like NADH-dependent reductase (Old Yellow Enzyme family) [Cytobacillus purgationiresistens]|uniref:2,4-dienoyl-CoA reductase-like NADH-dependent reductase (Old Yellow Enzyme family) n=1 Tax=Cytobacillus purgationiresistens TaxID=863449 RepID=A0ABU0AM48_9BACI|nr:2,4-dienoyl-CoA reductase-like NADH-dependent reductase (Old Yellow Enzyme family) [Cytobacillus purgationiresistens]
MNKKFEQLFNSFQFSNGVDLRNRLVMAPMTNYSSNEDGTVSDDELAYYARRSSGVGMVITACTYVSENGKGFSGEFAGHRDEFTPSLKQLSDAIKGEGAKAILQIFHGGRECPPHLVPNGEIVSASSVPSSNSGSQEPIPLQDNEIRDIIKAFGDTTRRAIEAGFDGVEIHGANGYLIQQFFSPHANNRSDEWGGTLEKRMAFPLAVVDEVQKAVAEQSQRPFMVGYRFSPEEAETPGITMADTLELLSVLSEKNLDYLHVSLQDFWSKPRRGVEDMERTRMQLILELVGNKVPVIGVGAIYHPDDAVKAMDQTNVPLLALGRELLIDPDWVQKIAEGREDEVITKLDHDKQEELVIPDPLWKVIMSIPGWVPGV